jgi:hypothetical protein
MKAVKATQALSLQSIDRQPDLDDVGTQLGRRDTVDGLIDECVDTIAEAPYRIRDDMRCHAHILPNICSPPPLRSTRTNLVRVKVLAMYGNNIGAAPSAAAAPESVTYG